MSTTVDTLVTEYVLHDQQYTAAAGNITSATGKMAAMAGIAQTSIAAVVAILIAAGGAAAKGLGELSKRGQELEKLIQPLEAVTGSAGRARKAFKELYEDAKSPGLELPDAVHAFGKLKQSGFSDDLAHALIEGVQKTNYRATGGDSGSFNAVIQKFASMAEGGSVGDLSMLSAAGIPIKEILKNAFDVNEFSDLEKKGIGAQKVFRAIAIALHDVGSSEGKFGDAVKQWRLETDTALAGVGMSINEHMKPFLDNMNSSFQEAVDSGFFDHMSDLINSLLPDASGGDLTGTLNGLRDAADGAAAALNVIGSAYKVGKSIGDKIGGPVGDWINIGKAELGAIGDALGINSAGAEASGDAASKEIAQRQRWSKEHRRQLRKKALKDELDSLPDEATKKDGADKHIKLLERIASATERTSKNLQKMAFGGGDMGALGITANELGGMGHTRNKHQKHMAQIMLGIQGLASEEVGRMVDSYARRGNQFVRS